MVLCFHSVGDDNWKFGISLETLGRQIEYMSKNFEPATAQDLEAYLKGKKRWIKPKFLITFDDGYADIFQAKELFRQYRVKPILFVLSYVEHADRSQLGNQKKLLSDSQILSLHNDGWEIGSHGATHTILTTCNRKQMIREIGGSKLALENRLKIPIRYFSYPKGKYNNDILQLVDKSGYALGFSMDEKILDTKINRLNVPRIGTTRTLDFIEFKALSSTLAIKLRSFAINNLRISI